MALDTHTLLITFMWIMGTLSAIMLLFWHFHRGMPGVGLWTAGAGCLAAGGLGAAFIGIAPQAFVVFWANTLFLLSLGLILNGFRAFNGRPAAWWFTIGLVIVQGVGLTWFLWVDNDILARIVVVSICLALLCGSSAYEMAMRTQRSIRLAAWIGSAIYAVMAISMVLRGVAALRSAPVVDGTQTPVHPLHFLIAILAGMTCVFTLIMMASLRLRLEAEEHGRAMAALAADRDAARMRAEEANRAKTQFLAMMSHELRTPLNAILGFSDLLRTRAALGKGGESPEKAIEYATYIHQSGTHLLSLIGDILDLAKAEAGKLEVEVADLDAGPVVEQATLLLGEAARSRGLRLSTHIAPDLPVCRADGRALKQILVNLVSNAIKFTQPGGEVRVVARKASAPYSGIEVTVSDTGIGIPEDQIERARRPFERIAGSNTRNTEGTGLGLAIVDALVQLQNGHMRIESRVAEGTTVVVRLPSAADQPAPTDVFAEGI
ncbi:MAG TPA: HAMP domain-containing sensor histidine kinase [Azospirillaceae bacterium]|nr:HAMP domain-containing sensor histidine kinase [Azospirillaceae bacterium]